MHLNDLIALLGFLMVLLFLYIPLNLCDLLDQKVLNDR